MEKKIYLGLLLDFYGQMLTDHQRSLMEYSCYQDYSLSEIAQLMDISRQGVRDALVRAERTLEQMEKQLHFAARYTTLRNGLHALQTDLNKRGLKEYGVRISALIKEWEGQ